MNVNNPFLFITPRDKDLLVGRQSFLDQVKTTVMKSLDSQAIITINGDFGIGKTLFVEKAVSDLEKRKDIKLFKWDFNLNTLNDLRTLPNEKELKKQIVVTIDRFELILSLSNILQNKILKIMTDLVKSKITLIITTSDDLLKKIKNIEPKIKSFFKVLNVPPMNFEETKRLIVSRLNESRKKKSDSIEPFTNDEVKQIYKNSKGNPRMVLLLCASLFEDKF
ncbi:MAG: hypothetical protein JW791_04755 [Nanoarchaeota archaeon]|nr:hypothetical protein [Nanoarchaeota archaeon]